LVKQQNVSESVCSEIEHTVRRYFSIVQSNFQSTL